MAETQTAICRFCHSFCGIKVTVEDGKAVKVIGDKENPMYFGYTCVKGRQLPQQHYNPERVLRPQRKVSGAHETVTSGAALDDIAARLTDLIAKHGPRSVALYTATYSFPYPAGSAIAGAFMQAIGSPMKFSSGSIDQPGKPMAIAFHGRWSAGPQPFSDSDTWMLVGANPVVSKWGGIPQYNPAKRLHDALRSGMKLIVIDPRKTECAEKAHIHLQCKPGEDPTILAGLAHIIIEEGLYDREFLESDVEGFESLKQAVAPFTPTYVSKRADVPEELLIQAARVYASGKRGMTTAGTGPNMAPRGTLTEYMVLVINTLCGRWLREGEKMPNPFVLIPERRGKAQAESKPKQAWGYGEKLRVRDLGDNVSGLTAAALADEILLDGEGQVKALISVGGNPMAAWPDQLKTYEAMKKLDLNVTLDIKMSATAKMADYVIPPRLGLEAPAISQPNEFIWFYGFSTGYPEPYAMYQPRITDDPAGADLVEEWEFFYGLAQRMGLQLRVNCQDLDMVNKPTTDDIYEMLCKGSRIPLSEVKKYPHGHIFDDPTILVLPKDEDCEEKLDIGNADMMAELAQVMTEPVTDHAGYTDMRFSHRLVSRRMNDVYNSSGRDIPALVRNHSYNPAFMNPGDIAALGLNPGDVVKISSDHASILGIIEEAPDVRPGVISMAHSFGDAPEFDKQVFFIGSNTGRLTNVEKDYDPRTGMPRMSAIPVNLTRVDQNIAAQ